MKNNRAGGALLPLRSSPLIGIGITLLPLASVASLGQNPTLPAFQRITEGTPTVKSGLCHLLSCLLSITPLAAILFLTSCASTEIYENGQKVFHTQADMTNFTYKSRNTYVHADTINHSNPMAVQGQAAAGIVTAATAAAIGFGTVIK